MTDQLVEDLGATRDYMKAHGRCARGAMGVDGSVCFVIAAVRAVGTYDSDRRDAVMRALLGVLPEVPPEHRRFANQKDASDLELVLDYNEMPGVTDEDVWTLFDKAIAEAGGMA